MSISEFHKWCAMYVFVRSVCGINHICSLLADDQRNDIVNVFERNLLFHSIVKKFHDIWLTIIILFEHIISPNVFPEPLPSTRLSI
jgi:hypothetical protein